MRPDMDQYRRVPAGAERGDVFARVRINRGRFAAAEPGRFPTQNSAVFLREAWEVI